MFSFRFDAPAAASMLLALSGSKVGVGPPPGHVLPIEYGLFSNGFQVGRPCRPTRPCCPSCWSNAHCSACRTFTSFSGPKYICGCHHWKKRPGGISFEFRLPSTCGSVATEMSCR